MTTMHSSKTVGLDDPQRVRGVALS